MSGYSFGKKSLEQRETLHPDLKKVVDETAKTFNCSIICGHRNEQDQNEAFVHGKSKLKWPNSRHNSYPSEAVDLTPYPCDWNALEEFREMAKHVLQAAKNVGVEVEWGGLWASFRDYPHFQLKKKG